jgi:F-type H+-transporting ATPase subunit delta
MANDYVVARPYAKAVFALALENDTLTECSAMLHNLSLMVQDSKVHKLLLDPSLTWQQKVDVFAATDALCLGFLETLARNKRLLFLPAICALFEELYAQHDNVIKAKIISAIALSESQKNKLENTLQKCYDRKITAKYEIDKELIGGLVIHLKDHVIDVSISNQLALLQEALIRG